MKNAVIVSCFDWYKARLKPVRDILAGKGYDVTVLIADFNHIKKEPIDNRSPECTYLHVPAYKKNLSIARMRSHLVFGKTVDQLLEEIKPELIFCQVPPNNVSDYCRKYKKKHSGTILVLDIIDLWPESMPLGVVKKMLPARIWGKWRDEAIKAADYTFTECDLYQKELNDVILRQKTETLYLFKEQSIEEKKLVQEIVENRKSEEQTVKLAYLGSMNHIIDIEGICNVIKRLQGQNISCEVYAIGDGEARKSFEDAVKSLGCLTHFYGKVYDELEKIRLLAPCDYALNMMKSDIRVGLTIKSIDYLSYGLPLINNIKGDTYRMVEEEHLGVNAEKLCLPLVSFDHKKICDYYESKFSVGSFQEKIEMCLNRFHL